MAKVYTAKTKDDEVYEVGQIQVEETDMVEAKRFLTLSAIDTDLAVLNTELARLQGRIVTMTALKATVKAEAGKVKLKVKEEVIEE